MVQEPVDIALTFRFLPGDCCFKTSRLPFLSTSVSFCKRRCYCRYLAAPIPWTKYLHKRIQRLLSNFQENKPFFSVPFPWIGSQMTGPFAERLGRVADFEQIRLSPAKLTWGPMFSQESAVSVFDFVSTMYRNKKVLSFLAAFHTLLKR